MKIYFYNKWNTEVISNENDVAKVLLQINFKYAFLENNY